jgi:hypothetical protein
MQENCYCSLKAPSLSRSLRFQRCAISTGGSRPEVGFGIKFKARGWQADGCLNEVAYFQYVESIFATATRACR